MYHHIFSCVYYLLIKFKLDLMYGLEDMTDLAKLVIKYFKANSNLTWFVLSSQSNILVNNKIRKNNSIKKRKK